MRVSTIGVLILCSISSLLTAKANLQIHGYLSQGYLQSFDYNYMEGTKDGTFQFNEFGINFRSKINRNLSAGLQLTSKAYAEYDNNKLEIDWAYGSYNVRDFFDFDAGILKTPVGMHNEIRDIDMLRTFISLPSSVYDERIRDVTTKMLGVGIRRTENYDNLGTLRYKIMYGHPTLDVNSRSANMFKNLGFNIKSFYKTGLGPAGKLEWVTPLENYELGGLLLGGTYYHAETEIYSDGGSPLPLGAAKDYFKSGYLRFDMTITTMFMKYTFENLTISGEYIKFSNGDAKNTFNFVADVIPVLDGNGNPIGATNVLEQDATVDRYGYYFALAYRFTDWLELGGYYSDYITDESYASNNENYLKEIAFTTRFDIGYNLTVKLEGKQIEGELAKKERDNGDAKDKLVAFKITYSF